jgi:hypothetical protein
MFPLPILPAQPVAPGATVDAPAGDASKPGPETFASLLFLSIPGTPPAARILDLGETPENESVPEKGAQPEITDKEMEMVAALFATVPPAQQLPPQSGGVDFSIVENSPALPAGQPIPQPILSFAAGESPDQPGEPVNSDVVPENLLSAAERQATALPRDLFDGKDKSLGREARISAGTPTLSPEQSKAPVDSLRAEAEKIPSAIQELLETSGAAEKKSIDDSQKATPFAHPRETAAIDAAPRGLATADVQVDQHVEGASLLPSERSGFFSHDDHRGDDHESHSGGTLNQPPFAHGVTFQPVEAERAAAPAQNHSWSATIERLAAEISAQARTERQEISMRLEPPELGHVKIELALDGDRLQARVTTEFPEAGALIQNHIQELRQALQAHSLDLVSVQVDLGGSSAFSSNLQQGAESGQKSSPEIRGIIPAGESEASGEPQRVASLDRGGLSVWA